MPLPKVILDNIFNVTLSTIDRFTQHVTNKFDRHSTKVQGIVALNNADASVNTEATSVTMFEEAVHIDWI